METPLLNTKFYIPTLRSDHIKRERLLNQIDLGLNGKLTLVSAPAGFGKSTLVARWARELGYPLGWVSLDGHDNDPVLFLAYIFAAMNQAYEVGETVLAEIQAPQRPSDDAILMAWINELTNYPNKMILVLDDFHAIENLSVHQNVEFILENLPSNLHLILISRSDPPLHLARIRGSGLLNEIREADLRFTESEISDFFEIVMNQHLSVQNITALEQRTEGWAVGLQLAGLALQGRENVDDFISAFSGGHQFILDYLTEEVFERQPEEIQDFLMRTCILERMCAPLCNAVTGAKNGEATLQLLSQLNLFVIPLDEYRQWYRYHHLFAELLRFKLDELPAEQVTEMHERASSWYAENEFISDAIYHVMVAKNFTRAADLIEPVTSPMIGRGELKTVQDWIGALPDSLVRERPRLSITLAWVINLNNTGDDIEPFLQDAERALETGRFDEATVAELCGHAATLRGYNALQQNNPLLALQHMAEAMTWLPENDDYLRSIVSFTQGVIYKRGGVWEPAEETLLLAESYGRVSGNYSIAIGSRAHLVEMLIIQGKLKRAAKYCEEAIEYYHSILRSNLLPNLGFVFTKLGEILFEWNDLERAEENLAHGLELGSKIIAAWSWERDALIYFSRLKQVQGDFEEAQRFLEQAIDVSEQLQDLYDKMDISLEQARLWLAQEDLESAFHWALDYQRVTNGRHEAAEVMLARVLLAHRDAEQAKEILLPIGEAAETSGRISRLIDVLVLQSLVFHDENNRAQAIQVLSKALQLAEPEGFMRTFLEDGSSIIDLLQEMEKESSGMKEEEFLFSKGYLSRILDASVPEKEQDKVMNTSSLLNERENQILRLLSAGMKTPEIANELYLSKNTIKWYIRKIYEKLNVHSKSEAIEQGYRSGLLR